MTQMRHPDNPPFCPVQVAVAKAARDLHGVDYTTSVLVGYSGTVEYVWY